MTEVYLDESMIPSGNDWWIDILKRLYYFLRRGYILQFEHDTPPHFIRSIRGILQISPRTPGIGEIQINVDDSFPYPTNNWENEVSKLLTCSSFPGLEYVYLNMSKIDMSTFQHMCGLQYIKRIHISGFIMFEDNEDDEGHKLAENKTFLHSISSSRMEYLRIGPDAAGKVLSYTSFVFMKTLFDVCTDIANDGYPQQGKPVIVQVGPLEVPDHGPNNKILTMDQKHKQILGLISASKNATNVFTRIQWELTFA